MAEGADGLSFTAEEKAKYGFERSEMYESSLAGTVNPYDRHVFLCYKSHALWPSHLENSDSDLLPKLFASALQARKNAISLKTRLTICESGDDLNLSDGDVLIFPDMVKYRELKYSDVDSFVEDVLVNGKTWGHGLPEELNGSYVFVCSHNNRDLRCGICGPILIEKFNEMIEVKDLKSQVKVTACSHIGGHKYAGNVIVFSANAEGTVVGNWYGYVTPDDVPELTEKDIIMGEVVERIWRGQMGGAPTPIVEAEKVDDSKLSNGNEKQTQLNDTEPKVETFASCCQGTANGSSCCRAENVDTKQIETKPEKPPCWNRKWEQHNVLKTVAIVGAVGAVAVAAHCYFRRAR